MNTCPLRVPPAAAWQGLNLEINRPKTKPNHGPHDSAFQADCGRLRYIQTRTCALPQRVTDGAVLPSTISLKQASTIAEIRTWRIARPSGRHAAGAAGVARHAGVRPERAGTTPCSTSACTHSASPSIALRMPDGNSTGCWASATRARRRSGTPTSLPFPSSIDMESGESDPAG